MATATARFVVKNLEDDGNQIRVLMRAKTQAEGANTENPILFPDAECPEQLVHLKLNSNTTNNALFAKGNDVTALFTGPA